MFSRTKFAVAVAAAVAAVGSVTPAQAFDGPTTSEFFMVKGTDSAVGACSFLASGPSLDPSSTPYRLVGNATVVSARVVVSTSLRCRLRLAHVAGQPQVGVALAQALPGNTSAVAGDITVSSFGPFLICTMIDATFSDTSRFNPAQVEQCRPLVRV